VKTKSPHREERCHHAQKRYSSKKALDYGAASIYVPGYVEGHGLGDVAYHAIVIAFGDGVDAANVVFVGVAQ
jgi:hypothetical protein